MGTDLSLCYAHGAALSVHPSIEGWYPAAFVTLTVVSDVTTLRNGERKQAL